MTRTIPLPAFLLSLAIALLSNISPASAAERDIFDYAGQQQAGPDVKKIIFIGDAGTHGPRGNHEFVGGFILLARELHAAYPNVWAVVHSTKSWPKDVAHADAIIVGLNHGQRAAVDPNLFAAVRKGAGFMAVHFGVEVNKGDAGNNYLQWMGGYFETFYSVNPWWTPEFKEFPDHPICRGVKPFSLRDEWYYHMRFPEGLKGVTPILSAVAPLNTVHKEPSDRGGNPEVFADVSAGKPQHMAWAYDREDGGRGFGFTGLHLHANLEDASFRTVLLNGAAWVTKLEIPKDGVPSKAADKDYLEKVIDEAKAAIANGK
jgi:hypothetical protein